MAKIKNPLDDFQLLTLSDESVYIANDDTVGVEQTTILINSAKPNIVNEETGEPYVVTGEELNAINRDDNSSYFDLYEKSDVYYYPECPGTEGGGAIISYEVGNVQYDSLLPATATGITVTWEYTATTQNPDGTTTTTTGTASKVIPIKPNTGDDDKTISGTIKVDGTDVEIPYEVVQKGKEYQDITSYEVSNVTYPTTIPATATSITITWDYVMTYTDENGEEHTETGTDSRTIEIKPNTIDEDKTISGTIIVAGTIIEYEVVQTGKDYKNEYLTFIALEDTEFWFEKKYCTGELYYSLDNGKTWVKELSEEDEEKGKNTPVLHAGDKVMWKGTLTPNGMRPERRFNSTGKYNVSGNIMSVSYEDDFAEEKPLYNGHFQNFFAESKVVSAEKLYLQPTNLARGCYDDLFRDCEFLTLPPKLLATTLTDSCYSFMFAGCKSLTSNNLPELPATTLATYSYEGMFSRCTSITEVPKDYLLNVTKVINGGCYSKMFAECTGLTNVPDLPQIEGIDSVPDLMYSGMFSGCTSITEVPKDYLPLTKLGLSTYSYMFDGCTSLTTAPELPAPVLTNSCYYEMFKDCTSLNYIKCLATDISARYCTDNWVKNVAPTGTFVKAAGMSDWTIGVNGIPTGWEIEPDDDIVPDANYFVTKYYSDGENPTLIYNFYLNTVSSILYEGTDIKPQTTGTSVTCRGCYTFDEGEVFLKIGLSENIDDALYADFTETDIAECAVKEGIRHIAGSFGNCQSLRLVVLPSSITSIEGAFWGCNKLDKLDLTRVSVPPAIEENGFDSVGSDNFKIVVAAENLETYRTAQYWSKYADKIIAG